ncbi:hypothetical protein K469DRAFT_754074 [Zopfia rhizophila CBS 207.26]|uniref:Glycosyl transferase CAP10 domain-containing protein n=1 Tax=Zopfia rhizophila CBS 207.26 TaxID=1314779 RepID=A0A6A6DKM9_9PEZI|nr:hypothetical protein K469DRAFT_754074 [Zopfia rhizophila CBS 207.26]
MAALSKSLFRAAILSFVVITLCAIGFFSRENNIQFGVPDSLSFRIPFGSDLHTDSSTLTSHSQDSQDAQKGIREILSLTEHQCITLFPDLTKPIDDAVRRGRFRFEKSDPDYKGLVQGRIKDGMLYIISVAPDTTTQILQQRTAVLHSLYRALLTTPTSQPLPNTHFAFTINDNPKNNSLSFATPNKPSSYNTFPIPHYSFWSWPSPWVGSMDSALLKIDEVEKQYEGESKWEEKIDKVIWRGTPWFNPVGNPELRKNLLKVGKDKEWADISALKIGIDGKTDNGLRIEEFCRYKYVVYTEGVTYSGRLAYHQACASVLLTPPLTYLTHTSHLIHPIYAHDLLPFNPDAEKPPINQLKSLLPTVSSPHFANAIYVQKDWSDLESVILFLQRNPEIAERIARNQRDAVAKAGYLSPAAETCYWRSLIRGWAGVAETDESWGEEEGVRFETWMVTEGLRQGGRGGAVLGKIEKDRPVELKEEVSA